METKRPNRTKKDNQLTKFLQTLSDVPESKRTGAAVRKDFASTVTKGSGPNTMLFQASTAAVDRHGDIVRQDGWDLTNFRKNPIILFSHQYDQPSIGRAVSLDMNSRGLTVEIEFAPTEFAQSIYQLCAGGFLRAVSVGFQVLSYEPNKDGGLTYLSQELLEVSICSVPSNAEALRLRSLAAEKGITEAELNMLFDATEQALDDYAKKLSPEPEYIDEQQFRAMLAAAGKQIDDFLYRNTGRIPEEK